MEGKGATGEQSEWLRLSLGGRGKCLLDGVYFDVSPGQTGTRIQTLRASLQPTASWDLSREMIRE